MPRLIDATVDRRATDVVLLWKVDGDLEAESRTWLLAVDLLGGASGPAHQFSVRFEDGALKRSYSAFDTGMHYSVPDVSVDRRGDTWTAVFPAGGEIARSGAWRAALSFDEPENSNESSVKGTF